MNDFSDSMGNTNREHITSEQKTIALTLMKKVGINLPIPHDLSVKKYTYPDGLVAQEITFQQNGIVFASTIFQREGAQPHAAQLNLRIDEKVTGRVPTRQPVNALIDCDITCAGTGEPELTATYARVSVRNYRGHTPEFFIIDSISFGTDDWNASFHKEMKTLALRHKIDFRKVKSMSDVFSALVPICTSIAAYRMMPHAE